MNISWPSCPETLRTRVVRQNHHHQLDSTPFSTCPPILYWAVMIQCWGVSLLQDIRVMSFPRTSLVRSVCHSWNSWWSDHLNLLTSLLILIILSFRLVWIWTEERFPQFHPVLKGTQVVRQTIAIAHLLLWVVPPIWMIQACSVLILERGLRPGTHYFKPTRWTTLALKEQPVSTVMLPVSLSTKPIQFPFAHGYEYLSCLRCDVHLEWSVTRQKL